MSLSQLPEEFQNGALLTSSLPPRPLTPGPPPTYESLIFKVGATSPSDKKIEPITPTDQHILPIPLMENDTDQYVPVVKVEDNKRQDEGLPTYEAALKLEAHG